MSWQDQGRQQHGYFGSSKAPEKPKDSDGTDAALFATNAVAARQAAAIRAAVAAMPANVRGSAFAGLNDAGIQRLADTMTRWNKAGDLPDADFTAVFFDRDGGDPVVALLRQAAGTAARARSHDDLRNASTLLAAAGQKIGPDRLPRFVDDAVMRAGRLGAFARAAGKTAADAGGVKGDAAAAHGKAARTGPAAPAPGADGGPPNFNRFFDTLYKPLSELAKELGVPEDYVLGHAAHESWYLNDHNFALNNPFGFTKAGGANLSFASVADAIAAYRRDYGPQIKGAASPRDFGQRLQGMLNGARVPGWHKYNTQEDRDYPGKVIDLIRSIPRHKEDWLKQNGGANR